MVPSLSIAIALFSFVALIDGNTLHGFNHSLDCSKFKRDFDVIRSFPFTVQVNPVVTTDKTYAVINTASQIEELTIYQENYLPLDVFCLTNLQVLRVVGTPFAPHYEFDGLTKGTGLSPLVARLNRLRTLSLVNTTASYLPPQAIGSLTNLTVLQVDGCGLRELPSTLASLTNLQELKLSKNSLSSLPDGRSLSAFSKLRVLDMSHNRLRDFVDIYLIPSRQVSTMDFSYNQIDYVPPEIGQFYLNLYYLYLNDNKMSYFPTDIFRLIYLKRADFQRNPLSAEEIALVKTRFRNSITNCLLNI